MRIIAGNLKGRIFDSPRGHRTHPISDKVRGALFNALGDIDGLTVLDAFAGSGALSFEAISRGASQAIMIESDRSAQKTIAKNIHDLSLENQAKLVSATGSAWLSTTDDTFDVVLLDPPYDDLQPKLLEELAARTKTGSIVVLSLPPSAQFALPDANYQLVATKSHGDATLVFYRRIS